MPVNRSNQILIIVMIASFLTPFCGSSLNMSLPDIGREFHAGTSELSWVIEIFLLTCAIFTVPMGQLGNRIGKKKVFLIGTILFTLTSLVIHFAPTIHWLMVLRGLQGVAAAMLFSTGTAIIALVFPPERRGWAMGMNVAVVYIGLAVGPVIGGFLNYRFGWQSIFYFIAFLGMIAVIMTILFMKEEWINKDQGYMNPVSIILYAAALVMGLYGLSEIVKTPTAKYIFGAGILTTLIYIWHEAHVAKPLLPVRIFLENKTFAFSNVASMLNYSATFAVGFLLSLYLQMIMGYNSEMAGWFLLVQSIVMALLSPVMGALSDRYGSAVLASTGMGIIAIGLLVIWEAMNLTSVAIIIGGLIIVGVGFAMFSAPNNNAIMGSVPPAYFGMASSVISTVRLLGQVLSMSIVASILARNTGAAGAAIANVDKAVLLDNIQYSLIVFMAFCVIGIIPSMIRNR